MKKEIKKYMPAVIAAGSLCICAVLSAVVIQQANRLSSAEKEIERLEAVKSDSVLESKIDDLISENQKLRNRLSEQTSSEDGIIEQCVSQLLHSLYDRELHTTAEDAKLTMEAFEKTEGLCTERGFEYFAPADLRDSLNELSYQEERKETSGGSESSAEVSYISCYISRKDESTASALVYYKISEYLKSVSLNRYGTITSPYLLEMSLKLDDTGRWLCDEVTYNELISAGEKEDILFQGGD